LQIEAFFIKKCLRKRSGIIHRSQLIQNHLFFERRKLKQINSSPDRAVVDSMTLVNYDELQPYQMRR